MSIFDGLADEISPAPALVDDTPLGTPPDATPANPFSGLADEIDTTPALDATLNEAVNTNPDEYAKASKLAKEKGTTPQIVLPSVADFERAARMEQINTARLSKDFAVASVFFSDYDNAAQFHDDVDTFTGLEGWLKDKAAYVGKRFDRGEVNIDLSNLQSRAAYNALGIPGGVPLTDDEQTRIEYLHALQTLPIDDSDQGQVMKAVGAFSEQIPLYLSMGGAAANRLSEGLVAGTAAGAVVGGTVAAPTVIGEPVGIAAGAVTGGLLGMRTMMPFAKASAVKKIMDAEVGNAFDEYSRLTDEQGNTMDPQLAAQGAVVYGIVASGLEAFSFGKMGKVFSGSKTVFNKLLKRRVATILKDKTLVGNLTRLAKDWGVSVGTEGFTEGLQQFAQVIGREMVKYKDRDSFTEQDFSDVLDNVFSMETLDAVVESGIEGARASSIMASVGVVTTVATDGVRAETKSAGEQRKIDEMRDLVRESKAIQRNPEGVREFITQAATEDDAVYMPAKDVQDYFEQAGIDINEDAVFGDLAKQIEEAAVLDADVVIPIADFATKIAPSEHMDALREHMRLSADTLTPAESRRVLKDQHQYITTLMAKASEDAAIHSEAQTVFESVRGQLIDTGRLSPVVAKMQAQIIPAWVAVKARETGRSVSDIFAEIAPGIKGPLAETVAENERRAADLGIVLSQDGIVALHDVTDEQKVEMLTEDMRKNGWTGRPVVVIGDQAITGTHRLSAAEQAGIEADVYTVEPGVLTDETTQEEQDAWVTLVEGKDDHDRLDAAKILLDHGVVEQRLVDLLQEEIDAAEENRTFFQGGQPRGYYDATNNMIRLTEASDLSTFLHESAHFFLEMERRMGSNTLSQINEWFLRNAAAIAVEANGYLGQQGAMEQSRPLPATLDNGGVQRPTTNSNGQPIAQTEEGVRNFWRWFEGSKITDESGAPMVVYHGTDKDFTEFQVGAKGVNSNVFDTWETERSAIFFSPDEKTAKVFANQGGRKGKIMPVYLWITDPIDMRKGLSEGLENNLADRGLNARYYINNWGKWEVFDKEVGGDQLVAALKDEGYDGAIIEGDDGVEYVAFDSAQIKSAIGNSGEFDPASPNILEQSRQAPPSSPGVITEDHVAQFLIDGGTGDQAIDDAIRRATHEYFARGFEAYLMEGKAPSIELRDAFRAFARWLTDLYRKIKGDLNVNLDDQMRKVFDRMLATEDQIAAAEAADRYQPLFTDAAMAGMTDEEFEQYQKRQQRATDKGTETLREKILKQLTRETEAWWKDEKADRVKVVTDELKKQKVYAAIDTLRQKKGELKLDRATVKEMLGVDRVPDSLRGMTLTGMQGVTPDDAAAFLGYDSGHEMLTDLMKARPIKQVAAEQAEAEMKAEYGDILNDGTLEREAQDAAHNEERGKQILAEMKALARAQHRPSIDRAAIKQLAAENIGRLPLQKIRPATYRRAEIKAAMAAQAAMDKGDRVGALQAKTQQAMNFYLWRAATDAHNRVDSQLRFVRKYKKKSIRTLLAKAGNGYIEQIDGLLDRFQLTGSVKSAVAARQAIGEWAEERVDAGDNIQLTKEALTEQMRMHYKEVPFDTLMGIFDSIRNIDHCARFANRIQKDGELLDFLEVKQMVLDHLENIEDKHTPSVMDSARKTAGQKIRWHLSQMTKIPVLLTWLDGGRRARLMHHLIAEPFAVAAQAERRLYREVGKVITEAIANRSDLDRKRHATKLYIPDAVSKGSDGNLINDGHMMGHQVLAVALNCGNRSNLEKMLKGEGWVPADVTDEEITVDNPALRAVLEHMSQSDWDLVETIWDQINKLFPLMAEVHKRTSGLDLAKIEANSFEVEIPGTNLARTIEGGYYPVKYDPERSHRAEENETKAQAMADSAFGPGGMLQPSATTGAKIERTSYFAPIRLSLDVVPNHVQEVIHYITHYEAVKQAYKLTQDPEIRAAIKRKVGKAEYDQIRPWLNDIAKEGKGAPTKQLWDPLLHRLRFGMTLGMMGFKASTGLMQISGLSNTAGELGAGYTAAGMRRVLGSLGSKESAQAMWAFVAERSRIMSDRIETMDREMMNAMQEIQGKKGLLTGMQEVSMKHIAYIQTYMVDLPTWYAAYQKGLDEATEDFNSGDFESVEQYSKAIEDRAIARADWTVENVQGSGVTKDMAAIMRNQSEPARMLTMFFTFFSSMWNMQRDTVRGGASGQYSVTTLAAKLLFIYAIPVAYEMVLRGEMEDDDDETWYQKYLLRLAVYPLQTIPIVRDAANAIGTEFGFNITPLQSLLAKGITSSKKVAEAAITDEEISRANAKHTSKLAGALLGIPGTSQAWSTGEHLYNVIEEGDDFTIQELLFGPERN